MKNILTFESFINESYNKPRAGGKRKGGSYKSE